MTVVFYISGHGFGHASRVIEVVNALGTRLPRARIFIRTSAQRWLFDLTVTVPFEFREIEADTGIVQHDSLRHDVAESLRRAAAFYATFDERVAGEAAFLTSSLAVDPALLVIGDIPPLAFAAAARAGVASAAIGNFTWDWIYEGYEETARLAPRILPIVREAYAQADVAWRLPMHGGFEAFPHVTDVPFIARRARHNPEETRRAFGIPLDRPVVLWSFGGYGLDALPLNRVDCLDDYVVVVTETSARRSADPGRPLRIVRLQENAIYDGGFRYEDLVRAANVVLTKPGYGIIAECVANDTAVVYTSRGRFREYDLLVAEMPKVVRCAFLPQEDLFAGRWRAALDTALAEPQPSPTPRTNGAEDVASRIGRMLS